MTCNASVHSAHAAMPGFGPSLGFFPHAHQAHAHQASAASSPESTSVSSLFSSQLPSQHARSAVPAPACAPATATALAPASTAHASTGRRSSAVSKKTAASAAPSSTAASTASAAPTQKTGRRVVRSKEDREMLRKVSHSAIERRRRERINDKIMVLKAIVPATVDQPALHKLTILEESITYIAQLQAKITELTGLPMCDVALPMVASSSSSSLDHSVSPLAAAADLPAVVKHEEDTSDFHAGYYAMHGDGMDVNMHAAAAGRSDAMDYDDSDEVSVAAATLFATLSASSSSASGLASSPAAGTAATRAFAAPPSPAASHDSAETCSPRVDSTTASQSRVVMALDSILS
ncbi:hypothetical protein BC831DRAFT_516670 [Entophlyctis helioformis]|nr:hypothetical protein BC831DRAFT_516670 [Entophlyctis helioformis]